MSDTEVTEAVAQPSAPSVAVAEPVSASAVPVESTPVVETPAAVETLAPAAEQPSLLGDVPAAETPATETAPEVKPETEAKPDAEVKPEPAPEQVDAPLPTYEAFKLPEHFKADEKSLGEFNGLLGQLELAKGDHTKTQELGQKLIDAHTAQLTTAMQQMQDYYVSLHNQEKQRLADELKKDAVFGANGDATGQTKIKLEMKSFLQRNIPKEELAAFGKFVDEKGIGDALPVARLINTLKQKIDRYENEAARMLPGTKPQPSAPSHPGKGIIGKLYGTK